jgi:serine/threonine protein kinase/poly(3-hydroxybutyrate) depolymerase
VTSDVEPEPREFAPETAEGPEERALAECIDRWPERGPACVDEVCGAETELAQRVRARIASLARLGLLDGGAAGEPTFAARYRIERVLGRGGMGVVYLAHDEFARQRIALKVAHVPLASEGDEPSANRARARFEREVRAFGRLQHPSIVAVLDSGEHEGRPYYTMEYVEGVTLARLVETLAANGSDPARLSGEELQGLVGALASDGLAPAAPGGAWGRTYVEVVCRWMVEIAEALDHAHTHGVVHRDVKPSNILVRRSGRALLFDLGLARLADQPALTRTGDFAGSPYYAAPEQLEGSRGDVDRRSDVYSLGVTLYELLALRRPFEGASAEQIFRHIVRGEYVPLRRAQPSVSRDLETICATAMERERELRYPSAREFAEDLRRLLEFQPVRAQPVGWLRRTTRAARRRPAAATALALAALVLVGLPVGLSIANRAIRREQQLTEREVRNKSAVTTFLVDLFRLTEAERERGETISARELLDRAVARLGPEFEHDPQVRAELLAATGVVYTNLGLYERAIEQLDRALALAQSAAAPEASRVAATLGELARAHVELGNAEIARRMCRRALELIADGAAQGAELAARLELTAADAAREVGEHDESLRALASAEARLRAAGVLSDDELAALERRRARLAKARGDLEGARRSLGVAIERTERAWSPDVALLEALLEEAAEIDEARGERDDASRLRQRARALAGLQLDAPRAAALPFVVDPAWRPEFEREFQRGITALQARDLAAAREAFARCGELDPGDPVCAYNLACACALDGDQEAGLGALERAAKLGFGWEAARVRVAESDPDIARLREDPRGARILAGLREDERRARALAEQELHLPPSTKASDRVAPAPLLVVLHADGSSAGEAAKAWGPLATKLGAHLLAPSGAAPLALDGGLGVQWFKPAARPAQEMAPHEERVLRAVEKLLASHSIDRERVWIVGEGASAMLAFELAARAPGLFRAALLADGPIHPQYSPSEVRRAASVGLRVLALLGPRAPTWSAHAERDVLAARVEDWLRAYSFANWNGAPNVQLVDSAGELQDVVSERLARLAR